MIIRVFISIFLWVLLTGFFLALFGINRNDDEKRKNFFNPDTLNRQG